MASRIREQIDTLRSISSVEGDSLSNVVGKAVLLPITTFFASVAAAIQAGIQVPIATFEGLSLGAGLITEGLFGSIGRILTAGGQESAASLTSGVWAQFGPFTFVVAIGVVGLAALLIGRVRDEEETGNLIPSIPVDVPFIGEDEEGE